MDPNSSSSFCRFPFFNLMFTATGEYAVCCKYKHPLRTAGVTLQVGVHSLEEAWVSDTLKEVRESFLKGVMPEGCEKCRMEEANGIRSTRLHSFDYSITDEQISNPQKPTRIEIYPGNLCNLKCRICFATNSTKWIREAKDDFGYNAAEYFLLPEKNMNAIFEWLPHITELTFAGGEPFLYKEFEQLLDRCIETGAAENTGILINTNATIYKPTIIDKLKYFKRVVLTLSIDDIEERFEYQRTGANWQQVKENLALFENNCGVHKGNNVVCHICCTVSNLNIFYLPEIIAWLHQHVPHMLVYLNLLHEKELFCIRNLSAGVKEAVKAKLHSHNGDAWINLDGQKRSLNDIMVFMQLAPNTSFADFMEEIKRSDRYINKNFADVFPEYWELITRCENR